MKINKKCVKIRAFEGFEFGKKIERVFVREFFEHGGKFLKIDAAYRLQNNSAPIRTKHKKRLSRLVRNLLRYNFLKFLKQL